MFWVKDNDCRQLCYCNPIIVDNESSCDLGHRQLIIVVSFGGAIILPLSHRSESSLSSRESFSFCLESSSSHRKSSSSRWESSSSRWESSSSRWKLPSSRLESLSYRASLSCRCPSSCRQVSLVTDVTNCHCCHPTSVIV